MLIIAEHIQQTFILIIVQEFKFNAEWRFFRNENFSLRMYLRHIVCWIFFGNLYAHMHIAQCFYSFPVVVESFFAIYPFGYYQLPSKPSLCMFWLMAEEWFLDDKVECVCLSFRFGSIFTDRNVILIPTISKIHIISSLLLFLFAVKLLFCFVPFLFVCIRCFFYHCFRIVSNKKSILRIRKVLISVVELAKSKTHTHVFRSFFSHPCHHLPLSPSCAYVMCAKKYLKWFGFVCQAIRINGSELQYFLSFFICVL